MNQDEETLVVIKPDAVSRGLAGEIISRFERKGFRIKKIEMLHLTREMAEDFYSVHKDKPFFRELVSFITSGPVICIILEGKDAVSTVRRMIGPTKSWEAPPGTIRGDFSLGLTDNAIHASDSRESYIKERKALFGS
jgi:nucleoside-diphosphate kinase